MDRNNIKLMPGALLAMATLSASLIFSPASFAGGAMTIVPDEDRNLPQGTLIPQHRIQKIESKLSEFEASAQQQPQPSQERTAEDYPKTSN